MLMMLLCDWYVGNTELSEAEQYEMVGDESSSQCLPDENSSALEEVWKCLIPLLFLFFFLLRLLPLNNFCLILICLSLSLFC